MVIWRESWKKTAPADLNLNKTGVIHIEGLNMEMCLPEDYAAFMQVADGIVILNDERHFLGRYGNGTEVLELEYTYNFELVLSSTRSYYDPLYHSDFTLPKWYVGIAQADSQGYTVEVLINVVKGSEDYGKVYSWTRSNDPWMDGNNKQGLGFVADSFSDFMNNLTTYESL